MMLTVMNDSNAIGSIITLNGVPGQSPANINPEVIPTQIKTEYIVQLNIEGRLVQLLAKRKRMIALVWANLDLLRW